MWWQMICGYPASRDCINSSHNFRLFFHFFLPLLKEGTTSMSDMWKRLIQTWKMHIQLYLYVLFAGRRCRLGVPSEQQREQQSEEILLITHNTRRRFRYRKLSSTAYVHCLSIPWHRLRRTTKLWYVTCLDQPPTEFLSYFLFAHVQLSEAETGFVSMWLAYWCPGQVNDAYMCTLI